MTDAKLLFVICAGVVPCYAFQDPKRPEMQIFTCECQNANRNQNCHAMYVRESCNMLPVILSSSLSISHTSTPMDSESAANSAQRYY